MKRKHKGQATRASHFKHGGVLMLRKHDSDMYRKLFLLDECRFLHKIHRKVLVRKTASETECIIKLGDVIRTMTIQHKNHKTV